MDWSGATLWWLIAGVLVAAEMATGTFYLLMLALGVAAGALAAHAGLGLSGQLVAAALVGGGAVAFWYFKRQRTPRAAAAGANRDVNLDIGERVQVDTWQPDGSARIQYRGAQWSARFAGAGAPQPGEHRIRGIDGSELLLDR
jgi:membrane protein implicated in regulation of membrane protease activity